MQLPYFGGLYTHLRIIVLHEITCCLLLCETSHCLASLRGRVSVVELGPWRAGELWLLGCFCPFPRAR